MAWTNFNITVVHKNWTWVYDISTTSTTFQDLLETVQSWIFIMWDINKLSWNNWTWDEVWFSLTEWWNAVDLNASINTTVGWNDTTIYALYPEPQAETITGFYLDWTKYELGWWVTSVNWQTGDVTIDDNTKIFVVNEPALTSWWSIFNVEPFKDICERLISNPKHIAYIANKRSIMPHDIGSVMQIISHSWYFLDENNWMFNFIYIWFPFVENRELFKYYWDIQVNSWTASVANITANKINFTPSNSWTTGQVLTKTSSWWYNWQDVSWWLQVAPNSPITWIKYVWYGTEADYANLSQYYTDQPGDTEFHCF